MSDNDVSLKDIDERFTIMGGAENEQSRNSKVQVFLMRHPRGHYFLRVRLESKFKVMVGTLFSQADLDITTNYEKQIQAAAVVLAEKQNIEYHDRHDPKDCAKAAIEAWRELACNLRQKGIF